METELHETRVNEIGELSLEELQRMSRADLRDAARKLTVDEVRYLVDLYYTLQNYRIRSANQAKSGGEEPNHLVGWCFGAFHRIEKSLQVAMLEYAKNDPVGEWSLSITGIGPVIAAGLLAHIELEPWHCASSNGKPCRPDQSHDNTMCRRIPLANAAQLWAFAGLSPSQEWRKGQKRPWNARLKTLCAFKIGESFVKQQNRESDYYGHEFARKKEIEWGRNLRGELSDQANEMLLRKKFDKTTMAYKWYSGQFTVEDAMEFRALPAGKQLTFKPSGGGIAMLPPAHIHARARRWAVKLFLSHWFEVAWRLKKGETPEPPRPFAVEHLGHTKLIPVPNAPW